MNLKGYRTIILNVAVLVGIVPVVAADVIPSEWLGYILAANAGLNLYLRFLTTGRVGGQGGDS